MALSSSGNPNESSAETTITESQRHHILSSERRRILLEILADQSTPVDVDTLASAIEDAERHPGTRDAESIVRIATTLHHMHLPMLDEVGVVDYDSTANRVSSFRDRIQR